MSQHGLMWLFCYQTDYLRCITEPRIARAPMSLQLRPWHGEVTDTPEWKYLVHRFFWVELDGDNNPVPLTSIKTYYHTDTTRLRGMRFSYEHGIERVAGHCRGTRFTLDLAAEEQVDRIVIEELPPYRSSVDSDNRDAEVISISVSTPESPNYSSGMSTNFLPFCSLLHEHVRMYIRRLHTVFLTIPVHNKQRSRTIRSTLLQHVIVCRAGFPG